MRSRWLFARLLRLGVRLLAPRWAVGGLVLLRDSKNRVCLLRHRLRPQPWGLPGGYARWPETPAEAAARECAEELALSIAASELRFVGHLTGNLFALLEVVFERPTPVSAASKANFRLQAREVLEARWFTSEDLEALQGILPRHKAIALGFLRSEPPVR